MAETRDYISYTDEDGSVNISDEVLIVIAGSAAAETEGVHALYPTYSHDIGDLLNKKTLARSVKIVVEEQDVSLDVFIIVDVGYAINAVAVAVQKAVSEAIESSIGLKPTAVNIHVCGISLKKSKKTD